MNTKIRAGVLALGVAMTTAGTDQATEVALGKSFDVLIHLHEVEAAEILP
ncbi:hypothetical protein [Nonomuraea sp. NPDC050691]